LILALKKKKMPKVPRDSKESPSNQKSPRNSASRVALKYVLESDEDKGRVDPSTSFSIVKDEKDEQKPLPFASRSIDSKRHTLKDEKNRDESDDEKEQRHPPVLTSLHDFDDEKKPKSKLEPKAEIKPVVLDNHPPQRRTVTIAGEKLPLAVSFDPFWRFIAERKAIDDRRRAGMPPP
jgi:hypothetical protein